VFILHFVFTFGVQKGGGVQKLAFQWMDQKVIFKMHSKQGPEIGIQNIHRKFIQFNHYIASGD